ncbi:MAG TPA: J domain-containing protein [Vicinamibacterales bacterium]|nr:J domain-containing protein [Vicinamibacterales bacterium]
MTDFYILLGVEHAATLSEIKRAYKRLARKFHPDINPGDRMAAAQFQRIAEAYQTLVDPDRRRRYDAVGHADAGADTATVGFEGFDFSVSVNGTSASTFGDLFADVLHQRASGSAGNAVERGVDLHQTIDVSFEAAMRGGTRELTVLRQEHCRGCKGVGALHVQESRCLHCQGSGAVKSARGHMVFTKPCAHCGGSGRQRQTRCPMCGGQQVEMRSEALTIAMPPGLADGARIRVAGKGHAGRNGGESGDLFITVHVEPHPLFRREGDDLHVVVPVAVHEAVLGAKIDVPSLEGSARLRVPPGTQSGQRFRLRERGAPSPRDGRRGDLVVEARLVIPPVLDERSKELMREFGRINHEDVRRTLNEHKGHSGHSGTGS